ncbi:hypothetical protein Goklo_024481, partial [Gossypium klotzschianum]|nr:hypothetical protein [Gossypium klotzschianum]
EKCNSCGIRCWHGAFKCGKCRFVLDFVCLALLHSALHKIDEHMLNLTYYDDKEQSYCDICEQERDQTLWYYSCSFVILLLILNVFLDNFHFSRMGSHGLTLITHILIILNFLERLRAILNVFVVVSFAKK